MHFTDANTLGTATYRNNVYLKIYIFTEMKTNEMEEEEEGKQSTEVIWGLLIRVQEVVQIETR